MQIICQATELSMKCHSVGNPDYSQYQSVSKPEIITGNSLNDIREKALNYIGYWDLGSGNWPKCKLMQNGRVIGYMSYNGRFWTKNNEEIIEI